MLGGAAIKTFEEQVAEDKQKLKQLIRMCMNDEYLKAHTEEELKKTKRNKATFKNG